MIDYFIQALPIIVVLLIYFVRIETRFARLANDISWIKVTLSNVQCRKNPIKESTAGKGSRGPG